MIEALGSVSQGLSGWNDLLSNQVPVVAPMEEQIVMVWTGSCKHDDFKLSGLNKGPPSMNADIDLTSLIPLGAVASGPNQPVEITRPTASRAVWTCEFEIVP